MEQLITEEELSNLAFYAGEATCHPDPNYYLEFDKLSSPSVIHALCKELLSYRAAMAQDKWIPISERMPPEGEYVLCVEDETANEYIPAHDDIYTAAWDPRLGCFTTEYWGDYDFLSKCQPTHWHPLPGRSEAIRAAGLRVKEK